MSNMPRKPHTSLTRREHWLHALALIVMAAFTALGVYVLYYPSELLIAIFGVMMLATLVLGVTAGIVAVYKS